MRIQCTFNLAPELHEQHGYAIENLRAWQVSEKERSDEKDIAQQRRSIFHRDIYLSGLYLHQLSPELPKLVSEQYRPNGVNAKRITQQISSFDDELTCGTQMSIVEAPAIAVLDDSQWLKFEKMLAKQQQTRQQEQADIDAKAKIETEAKHGHLIEQLSELLTSQFSAQLCQFQAQNEQLLAELKVQSAAHSLITDSSVASSPDISSFESNLAAIETRLDDHNVELLNAISANQQSLLSAFNSVKKQMNSLSDQMSQNLANGYQALSGEEPGADQSQVKQLNTQLQRASKIKAKGLW
ncbi:hypothetical protein [Shewanella sp. KT0246]|uniref:hypothetical protein n=1 Tax=Shewanella sp. KT0246 TaxID=2815912 RepID=UPI001BBF35DF|nr:hypothetical protein [Shewanella sp. KT0246]GIU50745.1 hypothetical protein TUM4249_12610 [Shewanella sp. KT0246]